MNINGKIEEGYLGMNENDIILIHYQIAYQEMIKKKYDFSKVPEDKIREIIYPTSWQYINDKTKIAALKEAIDNKITIIETETLNKYLESL